MADIAEIGFRIDTRDIDKAKLALKQLGAQGVKVEKQSDGMAKGLRRASVAAGALAAAMTTAAAIGLSAKLVQVGRQTDRLRAAMITATGSIEAATAEFERLEEFATNTPFALDQVVSAFIRLKNLGLDPSQEALIAYGNVASGMGTSLNQFIEAVADAATAEFERLKEFGIRARNEGETIKFTFRGVETEVANNAAAIEGYLRGLGQIQFAGGMERQADTLDGAISNLGDSWDSLFRTILDRGVGEAIERQVRQATAALNELSNTVENAGRRSILDLAEIASREPTAGVGRAASERLIAEAQAELEMRVGDRDELRAVFQELQTELTASQSALETALDQASRSPRTGQGDGVAVLRARIAEIRAQQNVLVDLYRSIPAAAPAISPTVDFTTTPTPLGGFGGLPAGALPGSSADPAAILASADAAAAFADQQARVRDILQSLQTPTERYAEQVRELADLYNSGAFVGEGGEAAFQESLRRLGEQFNREQEAVQVFDGLQNAISSALVRGVQEGGDGMLAAFTSILAQMATQALQKNITGLLFGDGGGGGGGGLFGAVAGAFGFGGARANGGPVTGGTTYLVGERGPELFQPKTSGAIIPNNAMGGSVTYAPTVTINGGASEEDRLLVRAELARQQRELIELRKRGQL